MVIIIIVVLIIALISFIWKNKIIVRFDTLFRKGFKKNTDKYRNLCILSVNNGERKNIQLHRLLKR